MNKILRRILLSLTIIFINCNSAKISKVNSQIIEVGASSNCGDKGGSFYYNRIRQDSTIKISGTRWNKALNDTVKFKTNENDWQKLIEILNIKEFQKLQSGEIGNLAADGCIQSVFIKTIDSTYSKYGRVLMGNFTEAQTISDLIK